MRITQHIEDYVGFQLPHQRSADTGCHVFDFLYGSFSTRTMIGGVSRNDLNAERRNARTKGGALARTSAHTRGAP
jgi:hypothetical protein